MISPEPPGLGADCAMLTSLSDGHRARRSLSAMRVTTGPLAP